jgi:hypothetical protein
VSKEKPEEDDKEQSRRFVETAKQLETDKSGRPFHKAVNSIAQKKPIKNIPDKTDS